jgi:hypothetical protein
MFNSAVFETILSLVLIILVFSVLVSCVQEGYVTVFKWRGKMLDAAICEMLNDKLNKNFAYLLYQHPQVDLLKRKQGELPSYIPAENFADALIDLLARESVEVVYEESPDKKQLLKREVLRADLFSGTAYRNPADTPVTEKFRAGVESLHYSDLKKLLQSFSHSLVPGEDGNPETLKKELMKWYNGYMDRVTGWYKRKIKRNIFWSAIVVTLFFNLDFIKLTKTLYADSKLRSSLVAIADSAARDENYIQSIKSKLQKDSLALGDIDIDALVGTELPVGWNTPPKIAKGNWLQRSWGQIKSFFKNNSFKVKNFLGWLLFTLALSLGAPFWFDVLKKLVNMRNTGISPAETKKT